MVARVLHWHLCITFHIPLTTTSWHDHRPLPVVKNDEIKLLWDFGMITDLPVYHNRPDIVVFLKKDHCILFLEVAWPVDINVLSKEDRRYENNYREISIGYNQPMDIISLFFLATLGHIMLLKIPIILSFSDLPPVILKIIP